MQVQVCFVYVFFAVNHFTISVTLHVCVYVPASLCVLRMPIWMYELQATLLLFANSIFVLFVTA